ncbi:MAG: family 1 glycosylhydrolase [Chthoniobacterales bacterium]
MPALLRRVSASDSDRRERHGAATKTWRTETASPRSHGRSEFLQLHLEEVEHLRAAGLPLVGYFHWSLFDNYEWGTYTPRFGLFSIEFDNGLKRVTQDHIGDRLAETYARLIRASRLAKSNTRW